MKDPKYKMPAIPYGMLNDMLSNLERQINKEIERNKNPRDMDESDIPRKSMHGGKLTAHLLDKSKVADLRRKIENYREANKIPRKPWTPIEEGLPNDGQEVWAFRYGVVHRGFWRLAPSPHFEVDKNRYWNPSEKVTHWKPCGKRPGAPLDPEND